ncbi:MAG: GNAT family N-acetyltransferase, partial [Clostridia bacterium]|nr:GNAT family N-acetyltransferase [Clostridia bacterium]
MIRLNTERLIIYTASRDEMQEIIDSQADDILKAAYCEMLQGALDHPDRWEWYAIWIIERKDGSRVGDLCFKGLNDDGSVEIGYGIYNEYQGNGYATEAVDMLVSWALSQPAVTRVEAETEPDNKASQRVLQKCGFLPTGTIGEEGPRFVNTL